LAKTMPKMAPQQSQNRKKEQNPLRGSRERARARGEDFSNAGVDRSQVEMLPPTDGGGGERMVRERAKFKSYNPAAWVVDEAAKLGVNALDPHELGRFMAWHLKNGKVPADPDQAYYYWITDPRFPKRRSNAAEAEVNAAFDDVLSQMRAHGAGARQ
jgi:hypothetical protein